MWRWAATYALATHSDWALLYQDLLAELGAILANRGADEGHIPEQRHSLLAAHRERLIDGVRPVRALLSALVRLPWQATEQHPVREALRRLHDFYQHACSPRFELAFHRATRIVTSAKQATEK